MLDLEKQGVQMQTVGKPGCGLSRLAPTIAVSMATSSRAKVSGAIRRNPQKPAETRTAIGASGRHAIVFADGPGAGE
jgi:hypothetical protein